MYTYIINLHRVRIEFIHPVKNLEKCCLWLLLSFGFRLAQSDYNKSLLLYHENMCEPDMR